MMQNMSHCGADSCRRAGLVFIAVCLIFAFVSSDLSAQSQVEVAGLFTVARNFFRNIESKDYTEVWDTITAKSRKTIIDIIYKEQKKTSSKLTRAAITKDFKTCDITCKSFWKAYFSTFDPELVLEQSQWDIGYIKKNKAEILITHRSAESPAKLKMFKISGKWKVGFTETFWTFWTRK